MKISKTKAALAVGAALALSAGAANANVWSFSGTMTFINLQGVPSFTDTGVTGTFDLGNGTGSFDNGVPFQGANWHADVDAMYMTPGPDSWNWTNKTFFAPPSTVTNCRVGVTLDGCAGVPGAELASSAGVGYSFNLGAGSAGLGQFAAGVFFDWSTVSDIPVLTVMDILDDPSDGVMAVSSAGTPMATAPFAGQTAAFSGTLTCTDCQAPTVPVPAAVWLFGSGLLGLVGVARRKAKV
jgi:hypothetical protein